MFEIVGIDEAGRGAIAGPVCAAAVAMHPSLLSNDLIRDSKKLTAAQRQRAFSYITSHCNYGVGFASVLEIDEMNILQAAMCAMYRSFAKLNFRIGNNFKILVDGPHVPKWIADRAHGIIRGDSSEFAIAAASIVAKVSRDRVMCLLNKIYPSYNWDLNKGYPTKDHIVALKSNGPTLMHRSKFGPVLSCLQQNIGFQCSEIVGRILQN